MKIKNLMSENPITIDKNKNICDCLRLMYKNNLSRIPVVKSTDNGEKELVGIISEKDIANKIGSSKYADMAISRFRVSTIMVKDLITADINEDTLEVANLMLENNIGAIPIMDSGKLIGIVTKSDYISACKGKAYDKKIVKEVMTSNPKSIDLKDRLVHARRIIIDSGIGRLLITEENDLVGIITSKDIAKAYVSFKRHTPEKHQSTQLKNLFVSDFMTKGVEKVNDNDTISNVASEMLETGYNGYPVSSDDGEIVGIITQSDLLNLLIDLESE